MMWNGLWIYRWSWIPHACKTIRTNCAPGFCLQVVAVAAISLPHSLQPPRLLLWLSRQGEAGEEGGEALAREEREEGGVEEWVTVFQRSQRFRAGVEVKAALWKERNLATRRVIKSTWSSSRFSPRFSAISCCRGSCREQNFVPRIWCHIFSTNGFWLVNIVIVNELLWNWCHLKSIATKLIWTETDNWHPSDLATLWKSRADPSTPPVAHLTIGTPQALWSEAEKLLLIKVEIN